MLIYWRVYHLSINLGFPVMVLRIFYAIFAMAFSHGAMEFSPWQPDQSEFQDPIRGASWSYGPYVWPYEFWGYSLKFSLW